MNCFSPNLTLNFLAPYFMTCLHAVSFFLFLIMATQPLCESKNFINSPENIQTGKLLLQNFRVAVYLSLAS